MLPTLVLVGRPNVGKSTLFNRLTKSRAALVADLPGLTRDRHYGEARGWNGPFIVVDTGGFEPDARAGLSALMARQTRQAIDEADAVVFLVDARQGLTPADEAIAKTLRESGRPVVLAVNKSEGLTPEVAAADFHRLGFIESHPISATHGEGVGDLVESVLRDFPRRQEASLEQQSQQRSDRPKIAIVGRPNVGKSTLVNRLLGEERVIVYPEPGTTRDSLYLDFEREGKPYTLIDTAGLRRRSKVSGVVEKFSVVKTLQAITDAQIVILVLDAREAISDQDAQIGAFIVEAGRALVLAINKWEGLEPETRQRVNREIESKLRFLDFARRQAISALHGSGIGELLKAVDEAHAAAMAKLPTPRLTRVLHAAITRQQPPMRGLIRPKLRYAHQGGVNPPRIIVHGNSLDQVPESYRRYLENVFTEAFKLYGTPVKIEFKQGRNPYVKG
jgi:GTP-binding protein